MPIRRDTTTRAPQPPPAPPPRRPASRPTRRPTPRTQQGPIPPTLTSTRTKPPRANVDSGQRRYQAHPGRDHPETAEVTCPMTTLAVVNVDAVDRPAASAMADARQGRANREVQGPQSPFQS